jgi:hypothetical protein
MELLGFLGRFAGGFRCGFGLGGRFLGCEFLASHCVSPPLLGKDKNHENRGVVQDVITGCAADIMTLII